MMCTYGVLPCASTSLFRECDLKVCIDLRSVGEDDSLGGVLVDVHDEDRRLAPRGRWLPLENTSSGQVFVITMANKFGLLVLMLRQVTISAELLSGIKELSVSIRHMSRAVQFDKSSVTSKSTAVRACFCFLCFFFVLLFCWCFEVTHTAWFWLCHVAGMERYVQLLDVCWQGCAVCA